MGPTERADKFVKQFQRDHSRPAPPPPPDERPGFIKMVDFAQRFGHRERLQRMRKGNRDGHSS